MKLEVYLDSCKRNKMRSAGWSAGWSALGLRPDPQRHLRGFPLVAPPIPDQIPVLTNKQGTAPFVLRNLS